MHGPIESALAFLLFLPLFAVLAALYWLFPRRPRNRARRLADISALAIALLAGYAAVHWGFAHASRSAGAIWPQVLAALLGYAGFVASLGLAAWLRAGWLRRD
ncbi:hypothetical protein [Dokdonella sp.]|uniref:hypothetical protein n=1 Tax=Dokdonella sp. TaxID=2291710 RepID=UPI0031C29C11|nr:hypothetical protein [Dokdonella sp.]